MLRVYIDIDSGFQAAKLHKKNDILLLRGVGLLFVDLGGNVTPNPNAVAYHHRFGPLSR